LKAQNIALKSAKRLGLIIGLNLALCSPGIGGTGENPQPNYLANSRVQEPLPNPGTQINISRNVVWAKVKRERLLLDVFRPETDGFYPIVVNIHGGGWSLGSKELDEGLCRYIAGRGYTVFNINYRLAPVHKFPDQVNDGIGAVMWAKDHAEQYRGNPNRVTVMGDSAGGNLSAMVAFAYDNPSFSPTYVSAKGYDGSVDAAVLIYGVYDMTKYDTLKNPLLIYFYYYLGGPQRFFPERYIKASPVNYLDRKDYPAILIIAAEKDMFYKASVDFRDALEAKGVPYDFYTAENGRHGFISLSFSKPARKTFVVINDFLDRRLKGKN